ncbi:MAG TPA: hypothetical protein VLQ89_02670 [Candidatus Binatia bacterium]|nr:hypothetical protein [Candidatus Binatia bacterium]
MSRPLPIEYENEFYQAAPGEQRSQEAPDQGDLRVLELSLILRPDPDASSWEQVEMNAIESADDTPGCDINHAARNQRHPDFIRCFFELEFLGPLVYSRSGIEKAN